LVSLAVHIPRPLSAAGLFAGVARLRRSGLAAVPVGGGHFVVAVALGIG